LPDPETHLESFPVELDLSGDAPVERLVSVEPDGLPLGDLGIDTEDAEESDQIAIEGALAAPRSLKERAHASISLGRSYGVHSTAVSLFAAIVTEAGR
jgi:hypothetical protein